MFDKPNLRYILIVSWICALIAPLLLLNLGSNSYLFNINALGNLIASYFILALGIAIAGRQLENEERFYLFLLTLSLFLWHWAEGLGYMCRNDKPLLAMSWFKMANVGVVFIAAHVYAFTVSYLKLKRRKLVFIGYAIGALCAALSIFTKYFVNRVHLFRWGFYPQWKLINTIPYFFYFSTYLSLALMEYVKAWRETNNHHLRSQINYLVFAFSTSYLGSVDYLPAFGYDVYPFGYIAVMGWWSILAYAILKHRLMDITIIIRKTLVYAAVMGLLTALYLITVGVFARIFEGLAGYQTVFSSALAAGLITFLFQPLRKRVQALVDSKFFREYVDREEKLYELSREVITHTTPEEMGAVLMKVLEESLHPKAGALYLRSREGTGFIRVSSAGSRADDLPGRMEDDNSLAKYLKNHPQPFVQDLSGDLGSSRSTRLKDDREDAA